MTNVFIGGSRKISRLNGMVKGRTENILNEGMSVLIGDANGADKAIQEHLAEQGYRNVTVYCTGEKCRNNIGNWETHQIKSDRKKKDFEFYTAKDLEMSKDADYGFMLWEGSSVGTLNNILNLLDRGKKVVVFFAPENDFITVRSLQDLEMLLEKCASENIEKFEKRLGLSKRTGVLQSELPLS